MIEIKVTANLDGGNRVLTATDKVNTQQEAYNSIVGFVTWFTSAYASSDLQKINLHNIVIKTESQASVIFKYKSSNIKLQVTSKRV